jgi:hypothetical protein
MPRCQDILQVIVSGSNICQVGLARISIMHKAVSNDTQRPEGIHGRSCVKGVHAT